MDREDFRRAGHEMVDWIAAYLEELAALPVRSRLRPGELRGQLPPAAPEQGASMADIFADFKDLVVPGLTHWQHPRFFGYFPANNSGPSILGELLSAGIGVNGMLWQSSPAATELESLVMDWLRQALGLPASFQGVIQDSASTATLVALVCARERATSGAVGREGFAAGAGLRLYASSEAHSSVGKGARVAGYGADNVRAVSVDARFAMDVAALAGQVAEDRRRGLRPCCVVATVGTTSSTAIDPVPAIADLCAREGLWLHVDAALAGSAALLPELRWLLAGVDRADSFVFNPHKWLLTNFDCSAFYTRHPAFLIETLSTAPEYLRTSQDPHVINYRDWGLPLGRRFRALKLWFVLRHYGLERLRALIREHLALAQELRGWIAAEPDFELLAPTPLNTVCFRHRPLGLSEAAMDDHNAELLERLNAAGRIFLTHTRLAGRYSLRLSVGQTTTRREHVREAWEAICAQARTPNQPPLEV